MRAPEASPLMEQSQAPFQEPLLDFAGKDG